MNQFPPNQQISQQLAQCEHFIQQLVQQTQQASGQYQQLLKQEQNTAMQQGHQTTIQQLQNISGLCKQIAGKWILELRSTIKPFPIIPPLP